MSKMFLTIQQKFYLDIVRKFKCLRFTQLYALLQSQFHVPGQMDVSEEHMAAMLRQLRHCNWDIHAEGEYVYIANALPDPRLLEAIDVMLELSQRSPPNFGAAVSPPVLLRFALGGEKLRLFSVASLSMTASIDVLIRRKMERIVWISDEGTVPEDLTLPPKHFFAARQEDGTHRFYGSTEP